MRAASVEVIDYLNAVRAAPDGQMIMADCFTFTLSNGAVLTFTNSDAPINWNNYVYLASSILVDGLKFKSSAGLEVDQQEITISALPTEYVSGNAGALYTLGGAPLSTLTSGNIELIGGGYLASLTFLEALAAGVFDGAFIQRERVFLNSWSAHDRANPIGSVVMFHGRVGTIDKVGRTSATLTVNSDLVLLDIPMPRRIYSPNCQHVLYDQGCTMVKANFEFGGTVGAGSTNAAINWSGANANFVQGTITFTNGMNYGISATVKSVVAAVSLVLAYPLQEPCNVGDTFNVYYGCDHSQATCESRFINEVNFFGFPFVPAPMYALF